MKLGKTNELHDTHNVTICFANKFGELLSVNLLQESELKPQPRHLDSCPSTMRHESMTTKTKTIQKKSEKCTTIDPMHCLEPSPISLRHHVQKLGPILQDATTF